MNSLAFIFLLALVSFLTGFAKGGFNALAALMTPLLSLMMTPAEAVGIVLLLYLIGDAFAVYTFRGEWNWAVVWSMLPAAVIGSLAGTWLLTVLSPGGLRWLLAVFVLFLVAYKVASDRFQAFRYNPQSWHGPLAGGVAGVFSGMFNSGGPTFNAYLLLQKLEPRTFVATASLFFAVLNLVKLPFYLVAGVIHLDQVLGLAWAVLLVPLGIYVGRKLVTRLDSQRFDTIVLVLLICSSLLLIWQTR